MNEPTTTMLSTCCGARPAEGVCVKNQRGLHTGFCGLCHEYALFTLTGDAPPDSPSAWLLTLDDLPRHTHAAPTAPFDDRLLIARAQLASQQRAILVLAISALAGWLAFIALGTWLALTGGLQGGQRSEQGLIQKAGSGTGIHAQQGNKVGAP